jgi:hypothetical protein
MKQEKIEQGQGSGTLFKERGIAAQMAISLRLASKFGSRYPFYWGDLYAGSGYNQKAECLGSPMAFLNVWQSYCSRFPCGVRAVFAERREEDRKLLCELLQRHRNQIPNLHVYSDGLSALNELRVLIAQQNRRPDYAVGAILLDPNGHIGAKNDEHLIEPLIEFSVAHPRIDLLVNVNSRFLRIACGHIKKQKQAWLAKPLIAPSDFRSVFHRPYGLIQERRTCGDPFITIVLRSIHIQSHRQLGYFTLDSEEGMEVLRHHDSLARLRNGGFPNELS